MVIVCRSIYTGRTGYYWLGKLFEPSGSLKFRLIHYKEMTGSAFGEIGLSQDVLDSCDWVDFPLVVDVLKLVQFIWFIDDPVSSLKVDELVLNVAQLLIVATCILG